MPKKNDFKLDVVSVRLVKDAPIYSEHTFNNPADIAAVIIVSALLGNTFPDG